jgi:hypothetical protein
MENLLDVYEQPYDPAYPVVCMDEGLKQLLSEYHTPLPMRPGTPLRYDYQYFHVGNASLFMCFEPLRAWRQVWVYPQRTKREWALTIRALVAQFPDATRIRLVLDNLNTHTLASLYEHFPPDEARALASKLELHFTPVHGSWLNMAEIELGVLGRQCLDRRLDRFSLLPSEVEAWWRSRNALAASVQWRFTTPDARIKLRHLYPIFHT